MARRLSAWGYTPNTNLQIFLHTHNFNLKFIILSGLFKRHLLEMDFGDLTMYICLFISLVHHYFSFHKLPIQISFSKFHCYVMFQIIDGRPLLLRPSLSLPSSPEIPNFVRNLPTAFQTDLITYLHSICYSEWKNTSKTPKY